MLIPDSSFHNRENRVTVNLITPNNVVEERVVEPGNAEPEGRIVRSGLTAKDRVVIGGLKGYPRRPFPRQGI